MPSADHHPDDLAIVTVRCIKHDAQPHDLTLVLPLVLRVPGEVLACDEAAQRER
jgi:hypothetical protein